jgi:hypothetical protein
MNKLFSYVWLTIIGSNLAQYYSQDAAYQSITILVGAIYFSVAYRQEFFRLRLCKEFIFVLLMLITPFLLMLISDRHFERGNYTSVIAVTLVFMVASLLASRDDLAGILSLSAFSIVAIATTLNLYELFVENNVWSLSPGRSAGLYINPNISGQALVGFGLVFLLWRNSSLAIVDLILMVMVFAGVFSTFSRAGILAAMALFPLTVLFKANLKQALRFFAIGVAITLATFVFASYVLTNITLSKDAMVRINSLSEEGGVGDYREDRGNVALDAMGLAMKEPFLGVGVRTTLEMREGPHNMFIAMMVDYGAVGVAIYILFILRMIFIAGSAEREVSAALWLFCGWLVLFSFVSHNLLDDAGTMPLFGFALARACRIRNSRRLKQSVF